MKIRTSFLLILALIAVLLAGTVVVGFSLYKGAVVDEHHREVATESESITAAIESQIRTRRRTAGLWAQNSVFIDGSLSQQRDQLRLFVYSTSFHRATVVDRNGSVRAVSGEGLSPAERGQLEREFIGTRPGVQKALGGSTQVNDPRLSDIGHTITISVPIRRDGNVTGAFVAVVDLSSSSLLSQIRQTHAPTHAVRITEEGTNLYSIGFTDERQYVTATTLTRGVDWSVTVGKDRAAVAQAVRSLTYIQAASVGFVLLVLVGFGRWLYRRIVTQLDTLEDGLESLESGEYDFDIDLGGADEWRAIGAQLNTVSDALNRRESQIRVLNRVLRHNLRNAMTVLWGKSEQISRESDDESIVQLADQIGQKTQELIEVADHARTVEEEMDRSIAEREPGDAAAIVRDRVDGFRNQYQKATITVNAPNSAWVATGHIVSLVVDELCRNALKHHPAPESDKEVRISVATAAETVTITVADNGPGLPPVDRDLLEGTVEETPTHHGSGLGLWLVQWLVSAAGGSVSGETDSDGTTITVTLPRQQGSD